MHEHGHVSICLLLSSRIDNPSCFCSRSLVDLRFDVLAYALLR